MLIILIFVWVSQVGLKEIKGEYLFLLNYQNYFRFILIKMGTLIGHLAPGAFFMTFGFWWSLVTSIRLVISKNSSPIKKRNKIGFHSTVTMPCFFLPCSTLRHAPVESWLKLIVNLTGIFAEIFTGTYKTINFPPGNYQHITMYMVFMIGR